jgi:hypothetical protein
MNTFFRLYSGAKLQYNSSIFDLVNGELETKQTKGLAYIFSQYPDFLLHFFETKEVLHSIQEVTKLSTSKFKEQIHSIEISAERFSATNKRADIVIKIDSKQNPIVAIIIEAKSIRAEGNITSITQQITDYLREEEFPDLQHYPKIGITLTQHLQIHPNEAIVSLTWNHVIQLLFQYCNNLPQNELISQYLNFLLGVNSMNFYEKEVLSVPAGKTINKIQEHLVYVCPDTKGYRYKIPLFVTFREQQGGMMKKLYKVEEILVLNAGSEVEKKALQQSTLADEMKNRMFAYLEGEEVADENYKFYILGTNHIIDLPHSPHPQRNNAKFTYYSLAELLSGKQIVVPESQENISTSTTDGQ